MSEAARQGGSPRGGRAARPDHRKGKQPVALYAALGVIVLLVATVVLYATGGLRGLFAPTKKPAPVSVTTSTPTTAPSKTSTPTAKPLPASAAAESAAAVKAAALPYPNPPAVTPETIRKVSPSRKLVAITIDGGIPFDTRILTFLESKNVQCTSFMTGLAVEAHPDLVKRMNADGFEIANGTLDTADLTKLADSEIRSQLKQAQDPISAITGNQAPYMRPPGGATNSRVQRVAASMGFRVVLWSKSFDDTSTSATPQREFHNVMDSLQPGDIILCHWGGKYTYEALQLILPELQKRGYTPVTLSELLKYSSTAAGAKAVQGKGGAGVPGPAAAPSAEASEASAAVRKARPASVPVFQK